MRDSPDGLIRTWLPVAMMMGASLISYIDRNALAVLAPTILVDTGMSGQQYGWAISCFSVAYMICNPIWGDVLDRRGLRIGMMAAVALWSVASFAHAFVGSIAWLGVAWQFALARLVLGAGEGATFPGAARTAGVTLSADQQGRGISLGYSGASLGALITPLVVTPVALAFGWRGAFWLTGLIGLAWAIAWLVVSRAYPALAVPASVRMAARPHVRDRALWAFLALYSFGGIPMAVSIYAAPIFLSKAMGVSQATLGHWLWIPPLGWELGYLFWGWVSDRTASAAGRVVPILAVAGVVTALVPFAPGPASALLCFFSSMFVTGGFVIFSLKYAMRCYPGSQALLAGLGSGAWSGLVALMMPIVGSFFDAGRYALIFAVVACTPVVGATLWAVLSQTAGLGARANARFGT